MKPINDLVFRGWIIHLYLGGLSLLLTATIIAMFYGNEALFVIFLFSSLLLFPLEIAIYFLCYRLGIVDGFLYITGYRPEELSAVSEMRRDLYGTKGD